MPPIARTSASGAVTKVPVEGGTRRAVVSPAARTLRDEMAVSGQPLLATSGQMPMAAHTLQPCSSGSSRLR